MCKQCSWHVLPGTCLLVWDVSYKQQGVFVLFLILAFFGMFTMLNCRAVTDYRLQIGTVTGKMLVAGR